MILCIPLILKELSQIVTDRRKLYAENLTENIENMNYTRCQLNELLIILFLTKESINI